MPYLLKKDLGIQQKEAHLISLPALFSNPLIALIISHQQYHQTWQHQQLHYHFQHYKHDP